MQKFDVNLISCSFLGLFNLMSRLTSSKLPSSSCLNSSHNDFSLRSFLSAFARSSFDECTHHYRSAGEPLLPFARQLPMDAIIARFPASRQLLEAIYFRLSVSPSVNEERAYGLTKEDAKLLQCHAASKEIINYVADAQERNEDERAKSHCYALLNSIARLDASSVAMLKRYYCFLENSSLTLGESSVACASSDGLGASWERLALKLDAMKKSTKFCIEKLRTSASSGESSSVSNLRSMNSVPSLFANAKASFLSNNPSSALSPILIGDLKLRDVENRLMLAVSTFPHLEHLVNSDFSSICALVSQLKTRMDNDKRLLLLLNELKPRSRPSWSTSQSPVSTEKAGRSLSERIKVVDLLHRYKKAVGQCLEWIAPGCLESLRSTQLSESLLSLSLTAEGSEVTELSSPVALRSTVETFEKTVPVNSSSSSLENNNANEPDDQTILMKALQRSVSVDVTKPDHGNVLNERNSIQIVSPLNSNMTVEDLSLGDVRPSVLIERFTTLYTEQRMHLLDAMDDLRELDHLEPLKTRLLLSIVVLSFRQCSSKLLSIRDQALSLAGLRSSDSGSKEYLGSLLSALKRSCGTYPLDDAVSCVEKMLLEAVSSFPSLAKLSALHIFVNDCVRIAWCLSVQQPPFVISLSSSHFDARIHERFYASTSHSDLIKHYIWPALCLGCESGPVICKAVVET